MVATIVAPRPGPCATLDPENKHGDEIVKLSLVTGSMDKLTLERLGWRNQLVAQGIFEKFCISRNPQLLHDSHLVEANGPIGDLQ